MKFGTDTEHGPQRIDLIYITVHLALARGLQRVIEDFLSRKDK